MPRHPLPPPPLPPWGQPAPHLVDKARLALEFEVGAPAVSGWVKKGMPTRDNGLHDLAEVVAWVRRTFDPLNGYKTRATAYDIQRWLYQVSRERMNATLAAEYAGAAVYEAAHRLGFADCAESLADMMVGAMVERLNPDLVGEAAIPLPQPPPGVWRARLAKEEESEAGADCLLLGECGGEMPQTV